MSIVLSRQEITELTRAHTRQRQRKFFITNGIRHYVDAHGWPVVTRAALEGAPDKAQDIQPWKSNKEKI